jgi:DNA invertase Pin-like site-specific DNA recombinase
VRVAGYIRVSTDEQGNHGHGLDAQRAAIAAWCEANGHELTGVYCDVISSRNIPKLVDRERAITDVESGHAQGIVTKDLDRFSRGLLDGAQQLDRAIRKGWTLYTLDGTDTSNPETELVTGVKLVVAQDERRKISKRTKAGLAAARVKGVKLGRPRMVPADVAARIVTMRGEGMSYRAIASALDQDKIPTPNGAVCWYAAQVRDVVIREAS